MTENELIINLLEQVLAKLDEIDQGLENNDNKLQQQSAL